MLDLPSSSLHNEIGSHFVPHRGLGPTPPTDPVLYRLYEGVLVYGTPIKVGCRCACIRVPDISLILIRMDTQAVIHEKVRLRPTDSDLILMLRYSNVSSEMGSCP